MGFVYNEDNADLSSAYVKDIAHHSPVNLFCPTRRADVFAIRIFTWLEKKQPSPYDTTKTDSVNWFLKEEPNADPTLRNALKEHFQIFSKGLYNLKTFDLQELLCDEHHPFTSALSECGRLYSCPKSPPRIIILVIYVITSDDDYLMMLLSLICSHAP